MGRKPVLGVAGALLTGLALAGCQTSSTKTTQPAWTGQTTATSANNKTGAPVGGAQPTGGMAGGTQIPGDPTPVGSASNVPGGGFPSGANPTNYNNVTMPNNSFGSGSPAGGANTPLSVGTSSNLSNGYNPSTNFVPTAPANGGVNAAASASVGGPQTLYPPTAPSTGPGYNTMPGIPANPGMMPNGH
jgi:hypothetical protein